MRITNAISIASMVSAVVLYFAAWNISDPKLGSALVIASFCLAVLSANYVGKK